MVRRGRTKSRTVRVPAATSQDLTSGDISRKQRYPGLMDWIMRITKDIDQIQVKGSRVRFQHQPRVFYFPSFSVLI